MASIDYEIRYLQDHRTACAGMNVNWYVIEAIDHAIELLLEQKNNEVMQDNFESVLSELYDLTAERDAAVEDLAWLASTTVDSLRCNICKYNPNDMGCELDGSQYDDDGECHFSYWRSKTQKERDR